jgi:hypothetical protein
VEAPASGWDRCQAVVNTVMELPVLAARSYSVIEPVHGRPKYL